MNNKYLSLQYWKSFLKVNKINGNWPVEVIYGLNQEKETIVHDNILEVENLLVFGDRGVGKTYLLHTLIQSASTYNTVEDIKLVLVDPKGSLNQYKDSDLLMCPIIRSQEKLLTALRELIKEIKKRKAIMLSDNFDEYRKSCEKYYKYILLVIDNYECIRNNALDDALMELLSIGGKYGVNVVLSTRTPLDIKLTNLFVTKVCFVNKSKEYSRLIVGKCPKSKEKGSCVVLRPNGEISEVVGLNPFQEYKTELNIDEQTLSNVNWILDLLGKYNASILIPINEDGSIYHKDNVVTIFNEDNYIDANRFDKHKKIKMKYWDFQHAINNKNLYVRVENNPGALSIKLPF